MKSRHRLTRRIEHEGGGRPIVSKEYTIDSDTYILANKSTENFHTDIFLLLGSGGDHTGGARPILRANIYDPDKWGIQSGDVILGASLKLVADSVGGSADPGSDPEITPGTSQGIDPQFPDSIDYPGDPEDPDTGNAGGAVDYDDDDHNGDVLTPPSEPVRVRITTNSEHFYDTETRSMTFGEVAKADYPAGIYPHRPEHVPTVESTTWNDYVGGLHSWEIAGGSGLNLDINKGISNDEGRFTLRHNVEVNPNYELNVTEIVKYALSNSVDFSVELFRALDETGDNNENLTKFVGSLHPNTSLRPTLKITYLDRTR